MKKYYEFQLVGFENAPDMEAVEKFRQLQLPGNFGGWLVGKFMVYGFSRMVKAGKKSWDKKILADPSKLADMPTFPSIHLMKVYEDYDKIMREMK